MAARRQRVTVDQASIVPDWPQKPVRGRAKRLEALRATPPPPALRTPQEEFPDWDWKGCPWGPPLDDQRVKAYTDYVWQAFIAGGK